MASADPRALSCSQMLSELAHDNGVQFGCMPLVLGMHCLHQPLVQPQHLQAIVKKAGWPSMLAHQGPPCILAAMAQKWSQPINFPPVPMLSKQLSTQSEKHWQLRSFPTLGVTSDGCNAPSIALACRPSTHCLLTLQHAAFRLLPRRSRPTSLSAILSCSGVMLSIIASLMVSPRGNPPTAAGAAAAAAAAATPS
jgi:hypothetical protein